MTFRQMNTKFYGPFSQWLMVFGIVSLCQPWSNFLHRYGLLMIIIGLVGFLVTAHISPEPEIHEEEEEDMI